MDETIVRSIIEDNFIIDNDNDELINFVVDKNAIENILKINKLITQHIEKLNSKRKLYLSSSEYHETLFIEINGEIEWNRWNDLNYMILSYMFNNNIENINIIHIESNVILPDIDKKW